MRVLIIDDEEDFRAIAGTCLGILGGVTVSEAENGQVGLEMAAEVKPDVILLDLIMPDMDGITTLHELRKNPSTENIPVIFMTTKGMFDEFEEMKKLGALAVITKPFDPEKLADQIRKILQNASKSSSS